MPDAEEAVVIIDNGSGSIKAGFSGDNVPYVTVIPVVGHSKTAPQTAGAGLLSEGYSFGEEALKQKENVELFFPITRGIITNWDHMEKIWHYIFYVSLRVAPEEHPLIMTEPVLNPVANRQKMIQIMFETFNVPNMYVTMRERLSLMAAQSITGLVLSSGDGATCAVPVYDGYPLVHAVGRLNLSGKDITEYMMKLLAERGHSIAQTHGRSVAQRMKEQICYVALDYEAEMKKFAESTAESVAFKLPNGTAMKLGSERFKCPEALFQPKLLGMSTPGVHHVVHQSIIKCDVDARAELFGNVVLAGGSTMFGGFGERLNKELVAITRLPPREITVRSPAQRNFSAWIGGSHFVGFQEYKASRLDRRTYGKFGPAALVVY